MADDSAGDIEKDISELLASVGTADNADSQDNADAEFYQSLQTMLQAETEKDNDTTTATTTTTAAPASTTGEGTGDSGINEADLEALVSNLGQSDTNADEGLLEQMIQTYLTAENSRETVIPTPAPAPTPKRQPRKRAAPRSRARTQKTQPARLTAANSRPPPLSPSVTQPPPIPQATALASSAKTHKLPASATTRPPPVISRVNAAPRPPTTTSTSTTTPSPSQSQSQSPAQQPPQSTGWSIAEELERARSTMARKAPASAKIDPMLNRQRTFQPSHYSAAAARNKLSSTQPRQTAAPKPVGHTKFQVYTPPTSSDGKRPEPLNKATRTRKKKATATTTTARKQDDETSTLMSLIESQLNAAATSTSDQQQQQESSKDDDNGLSAETMEMLSAAISELHKKEDTSPSFSTFSASKPSTTIKRPSTTQVIAKVKKLRSQAVITPEEKAKIRLDNRERKKKWRSEHAERNKDNDLKMRVNKRANTLFGTKHSEEKVKWVAQEITKRREKRIQRESNTARRFGVVTKPTKKDDILHENVTTMINHMHSSSDISEALAIIVKNKHLLQQFIEQDDDAVASKKRTLESSGSSGDSDSDRDQGDNNGDEEDDDVIKDLAGTLELYNDNEDIKKEPDAPPPSKKQKTVLPAPPPLISAIGSSATSESTSSPSVSTSKPTSSSSASAPSALTSRGTNISTIPKPPPMNSASSRPSSTATLGPPPFVISSKKDDKSNPTKKPTLGFPPPLLATTTVKR